MRKSKEALVDNVLTLVQQRTGPLRPSESGVSRLLALGLANGTAQRVLDGTNIRLETVDFLAEKLKVAPWELLTPGFAKGGADSVADVVEVHASMSSAQRVRLRRLMEAAFAPLDRPPSEETFIGGQRTGFGGLDELPDTNQGGSKP